MLDFLFTKTPLFFFTQNLWRDEAFSYMMAEKSIFQIFGLTAGDFSPPFYYLVLHFWTKIFSTTEVGLRSLSFVCYALTIFIVYEILIEVFKIHKARAAIYLLIFFLNPFLTYYAFEARMYMMVTFLVTLSYFALWKKHTRLYVISITLALYTHYFAIFILAAQIAGDVIKDFEFYGEQFKKISHSIRKSRTFVWKHVRDFTVEKKLFFLPMAFFIPWVIFTLWSGSYRDGSFWVIRPALKEFLYIPFLLYSGYERIYGEYYHGGKAGYYDVHINFLYLLYVILLTPILVKAFFTFLKHKKAPLITTQELQTTGLIDILLWSFFPPIIIFLLSLVIQPAFHPRYYIFSSVGFLLVLIYIFEYFFSLKKTKIPLILGIVLFVFLLVKTNDYTKLNIRYHYKHNVAGISNEIKNLLKPEDYAYVSSELDYHLYQYYIGESRIKIYGKTYDEIPSYVGKVLIPKEALTSSFPNHPHRAFLIFWNTYIVRSN